MPAASHKKPKTPYIRRTCRSASQAEWNSRRAKPATLHRLAPTGPTQLALPEALATRATLPRVTRSRPPKPSQRATVGSCARTTEGALSRAGRQESEVEPCSNFSVMALLGMIGKSPKQRDASFGFIRGLTPPARRPERPRHQGADAPRSPVILLDRPDRRLRHA